MTVIFNFAAFREMRDGCRQAAEAADRRGDAAYAAGCRAAAAGLLVQVPPPAILPGDMDDLLEQRAAAHKLADHAWHATRHSYDVVSRQGAFARRLDALVTRRAAQ